MSMHGRDRAAFLGVNRQIVHVVDLEAYLRRNSDRWGNTLALVNESISAIGIKRRMQGKRSDTILRADFRRRGTGCSASPLTPIATKQRAATQVEYRILITTPFLLIQTCSGVIHSAYRTAGITSTAGASAECGTSRESMDVSWLPVVCPKPPGPASCYADACFPVCRNASNSALIWFFKVEHMPWGPPG